MEYNIHYLNKFEPAAFQSFIEEEIKYRIGCLKPVLEKFSSKRLLHIFLKKIDATQYLVFASVYLGKKEAIIKEEGNDVIMIIRTLFDKLGILFEKQLEEQNKHLGLS